jgi:hypothetical protein
VIARRIEHEGQVVHRQCGLEAFRTGGGLRDFEHLFEQWLRLVVVPGFGECERQVAGGLRHFLARRPEPLPQNQDRLLIEFHSLRILRLVAADESEGVHRIGHREVLRPVELGGEFDRGGRDLFRLGELSAVAERHGRISHLHEILTVRSGGGRRRPVGTDHDRRHEGRRGECAEGPPIRLPVGEQRAGARW